MTRAMETTGDDFLTLPAWFPAAKAAAVLRSQGKRLALIADRNGVSSVAALEELAAAPANKSISWCAAPLGPAVAPATSQLEVRRLMDADGSAYLPVVMGGVVLSILARDSVGAARAPELVERLAA
jgi:hypothetical protein